jgi:hypothetical protein
MGEDVLQLQIFDDATNVNYKNNLNKFVGKKINNYQLSVHCTF